MTTIKIKTVIFDADGMVVRGKMFSEQLATIYQIPYEKILPFFEKEFLLCLTGKADLKKEIVKYFSVWGWKKKVSELLNFWFEMESNIDHKVIRVIKKLRQKGIRCVLATNQEKYRTQYLINKMKLAKHFDLVVSSANIGFRKPEKEFYQYLKNMLNKTKSSEVLFWDNRTKNVSAARKLGFQVEVYRSFVDFKTQMKKLFPEYL